ncbi:MAG: CaiB/BaiF CoA transferase family protein [Dehalococcoidia bacterium]
MANGALADLRVLDISVGVAGPYCTKLLAGLGAEVIKVEPPGGDPTRRRGPFPGDEPHPEKSGAFLHLNAGKLGITLDVTTAAGCETIQRLACDTDVLVESAAPGYLASLGLGYDDLAAVNPGIIVVSITPFGQDGPYSQYHSTEIVTYALSGYILMSGDPDRPPLKAYSDQTELQGGQQAATASMVALFARELTGLGQHVDVSICEAGSFLLGGMPQSYFFRGDRFRRTGTRVMNFPPTGPYPSTIRPCKDGYVHAHMNPRHPDLMATLMEEPDLADPEVMATPYGHADQIDELMQPWLNQHDKFEAVRRAQELRLPFTEVLTPAEVMADPAHHERGFWTEITHPVAGTLTQPGAPVQMSRTPWQTGRAPLLGEHNETILCDRLGYSREDLTILRDRGVI